MEKKESTPSVEQGGVLAKSPAHTQTHTQRTRKNCTERVII